jgi:ABC-type dipeptide/oligopeptide/nickel transport system permease component
MRRSMDSRKNPKRSGRAVLLFLIAIPAFVLIWLAIVLLGLLLGLWHIQGH